MKLDRYTEKAQETILNAQRLATEAESPVLDAEHLLAALLADDEGTPAATLGRLGVDVPLLRTELAAALAHRARVRGSSLSLDKRAQQLLERAEDEARRLQDEYVSTDRKSTRLNSSHQ